MILLLVIMGKNKLRWKGLKIWKSGMNRVFASQNDYLIASILN